MGILGARKRSHFDLQDDFFFEIFFSRFIYLFMIDIEREREREAETQEEGEAGSMLGAPRGTRSRDSALVSPGSKAGAKPLSHPGIPPN